MEYISKAGRRWIARHKIGLADLNAEASRYGGTAREISRQRIDPKRFHIGHWSDKFDTLQRRGKHWVLCHRYHNYIYQEQGSGHAKLSITGATLLGTVCSALYQSAKPLPLVAEIPPRSCIGAANPLIIRATEKIGSIEFLLRIDWCAFEPAWEPAKSRTRAPATHSAATSASFDPAQPGRQLPSGRSLYERMKRVAADQPENL